MYINKYLVFPNGFLMLRLVCCLVIRTLAEMAAATSLAVVAIIEPIIQHADWFFPEGKTL